MVEYLKDKDRCVKRSNKNSQDKEMSSWKKEDCKSCLKSNNLACSDILAVLKTRCYLMEDTSNAEMSCLMALSIKDLKTFARHLLLNVN